MGIYGYTKKKKESFVGRKDSLPSMIEVISSSKSHTKLFELIKRAGLINALKAADNITVFAPTDAALKTIGDDMSVSSLKSIILGHILQYTRSPPPNHEQMKSFRTMRRDNEGTVRINASKVTKFMKNGVKTRNGTLYVIDIIL